MLLLNYFLGGRREIVDWLMALETHIEPACSCSGRVCGTRDCPYRCARRWRVVLSRLPGLHQLRFSHPCAVYGQCVGHGRILRTQSQPCGVLGRPRAQAAQQLAAAPDLLEDSNLRAPATAAAFRAAVTSVPFPTFVSFRSTRFYERRKQRDTSKSSS